MQRTTIRTKNDKIYIDREFQVGEERWTVVTRLASKTLTEALTRLPHSWLGKSEIHETAVE